MLTRYFEPAQGEIVSLKVYDKNDIDEATGTPWVLWEVSNPQFITKD